jgi:hypothetical protein
MMRADQGDASSAQNLVEVVLLRKLQHHLQVMLGLNFLVTCRHPSLVKVPVMLQAHE